MAGKNNVVDIGEYRELSESLVTLTEEKENSLFAAIELLIMAREDIENDPDFDPNNPEDKALILKLNKLMQKTVNVNKRFDQVLTDMDGELHDMRGGE